MSESGTTSALPWTGERMVPESTEAGGFWQHIERYRFAARFARGKRILDIACGEGYGTKALQRSGAASVIGMDVSPEAAEHARQRYGVDARVGDATAIPLPDQSLDMIVSMETIEHIPQPERFLDECVRLLVPGGRLVVSTPDKTTFAELGIKIPFHVSEMTEVEFQAVMARRFRSVKLYGQWLLRVRNRGLRTLAAPQTRRHQFPGYWRLRSWLCPQLLPENEPHHRNDPVSAVLRRDLPLAYLMNPFEVRPYLGRERETVMFFVAMAVRG